MLTMCARHILMVCGIATCLIFSGYDCNADSDKSHAKTNSAASDTSESLRRSIAAALSAEIPDARHHLLASEYAANISDKFLLDEAVLNLAEVVVAQTKRDNLFGSFALVPQNSAIGVSVSSLPLTDGNWEQALTKFSAQFDKISEHYLGQTAGISGINGFVHVYLGIEKSGIISAAIGIAEVKGRMLKIAPRQFPASSNRLFGAPLSMKDLPAKRCDVDAQGELVLPGEGYLLSAEDVEKSDEYWASIAPVARDIMHQTINNDKSPWLVSEKHIGKFNVDKSEARKRALDMWNRELDAANHQ